MSSIAMIIPLVALLPLVLSHADNSLTALLIFFFASTLADNGHIVVTAFKIFGKNREIGAKAKYLGFIAISIAIPLLWLKSQAPFFWSFFIYFTAFHHMRQNWGVFCWLSLKEGVSFRFLKAMSYCCFLVPFLFLHLRSDIQLTAKATGIISLGDSTISVIQAKIGIENLRLSLAVGMILFACSFLFQDREKRRSSSLGFYVLSVTSVNTLAMMYGRDFFEILLPLMITHGYTYFLVISDSLVRVQKWAPLKAIILVLTAALFYGMLDTFLQPDDLYEYQSRALSPWVLFGVSITAGLSIAHYFIDGFIWKKSDKDYAHIFES
jgi:hypothetical protein